MALSWNEIKERAVAFSKEWEDTEREEAEAKPFLVAFFNVFGINQRKIATFEHRVKKLNEHDGYIDLFWKGTLIIEMKSRGKDLEKAFQQAKDYTQKLQQEEIPKYILISDFAKFNLYDIEEETKIEFNLNELVNNVQYFGFIAGYEKKVFEDQDPVNIQAAELMGKLHDRLKEIGYTDHPLEVYLVRVLFCLFAEDTTIFEKQSFQDYIEKRTNEDGSDLAAKLQEIFQVLNTPKEKRYKNLDEELNKFPYVNGKLFEEVLPVASFDSKMRKALLECCHLDWSKISPAIFGSMFQSVMKKEERRNLGAHYTSEKNILKLIGPLFLAELYEEFEIVKGNKNKLIDFHKKLGNLKFLDPACGCGNFLVITYRELRLLEIEVLKVLSRKEMFTDIKTVALIDVDQMYGIEIEEFPSRVAEVAMCLIDHQMNQKLSSEFGLYFLRLPLQKAANILNTNALRVEWGSLIKPRIIETYFYDMGKKQATGKIVESKEGFSYILGNPPFVGHHLQSERQKEDLHLTLKNIQAAGVMDYVSAWFYKASEYVQKTDTKIGFVATNSITQGEQVCILWKFLIEKFNMKIHFAHRTFKWSNEAKGNAAVYCVIIGFSNFDTDNKLIFEYEDIKGEPHAIKTKNINPYLVDAKDILIENRSKPICVVPQMMYGSKPTDGGYFIFTDEEKKDFLKKEPLAKKYIKPFISAKEFLNNEKRWCLWLVDAQPNEIKNLPEVLKRIDSVKKFRSESVAASTRNYKFHTLFRQVTQPKSNYLIIPLHTSENRQYIPIGFFTKDDIANNSCSTIPNAELFHFAIVTSYMHMTWVKNTCGRIKGDFRYSKDIVYNNFPWPFNPAEKQIKSIEICAQRVLDLRNEFPNSSLADLYDPRTMPPKLLKAHQDLDKTVDLAYRSKPFETESKRMEFLFELYEKYTANLFTKGKSKKKKS